MAAAGGEAGEVKTPKPIRKLLKRATKLLNNSPAFRKHLANSIFNHLARESLFESPHKSLSRPTDLVIDTGAVGNNADKIAKLIKASMPGKIK